MYYSFWVKKMFFVDNLVMLTEVLIVKITCANEEKGDKMNKCNIW